MVREFLAVAARAVVQWALATLMLANGAAFCLVAAVSERLRLGPPCILCARVHRLLCSSAGGAGEGRDALRLLCNAHLSAVAATGTPRHALEHRSAGRKGLEVDYRDKISGLESRRVVSIGSEICEQDRDTNGSGAGRAGGGTDNTSESPLVSLFELAPIVAHPRDNNNDNNGEQSFSLHKVEGGERLTVGQLLSLRAQRRELDALRAELDSERRARVEAEEQQRQVEEQGELDREAARLTMELVHETEREKRALQQQLDACRAYQAQLYAGGHHAGGEEEKGGAGDSSNNNYQSLVDFFPGSVCSSSPDLANLMKLYTESASAGNNGERGQREGAYVPAVAMLAEDVEEEEQVTISAVKAGSDSSVYVDAVAAIAGQVETVTEAA